MQKKIPHVHYDSEAKVLSIRLSHNKSVDSDLQKNVVLDYDADGNLVNVDIMQVSLSEFQKTPAIRRLVQMWSRA